MVGRGSKKKKKRANTHAVPNTGIAVRCNESLPTAMSVNYQQLFDHAADAILIIGPDGAYIDANEAACRMTGFTRDELLAKRVGDLHDPSEQAYSDERFAVLQALGTARDDRILIRRDGTQLAVEAHAVALGDDTYQTTVRDVSLRVIARDDLQRSLDDYERLVDLCQAAVVSVDVDGCVQSWNLGATELFGYTSKEMIGSSLETLIPERHLPAHQAGIASHAALDDGAHTSRTLEAEAVRKDGSEVAVEISVGIGRGPGGAIYTAVIRDITERRRVLEELNDAVQRLQFHVERMPLAYIVWNLEFRVVEWNPAAERIFGYTKSEAMGRGAYDLLVPPEMRSIVEPVWSDLLRGDTSSHLSNVNMRKDGSRLTCEWYNTALYDSQGNIRGVASMGMNISERALLESRIRDTQKLESLGVLAAGIAHDFNSALMVILGNASLLRSLSNLPGRAPEHIELIDAAGARAKVLVEHLLAYARTGRHNPEPTAINSVVHDTTRLLRSVLDERHELTIHLGDGLPSVVADRSQVEQILHNLCLNAKEAMPDGGSITLRTRAVRLTQAELSQCVPYEAKPGRYVEIVVTDKGCGMSEATIARMFDPFFTTKINGHGLGMAAVFGILRQHGAAIWVESELGTGTTVHVYFPAAPKSTPKLIAD